MASGERCHYIRAAGLRGAKESNPRGLTILTGAVPAGPLGSVTWRPPTYVGSRDQRSYGQRGSALDCFLWSQSAGIEDTKAALRREASARRDALPAETRNAAAETIAARPFPLSVAAGAIVSGFMPLKNEIDPLPLLRKLSERARGWRCLSWRSAGSRSSCARGSGANRLLRVSGAFASQGPKPR